jgi:uncharacterized phage protein gp47/JayE
MPWYRPPLKTLIKRVVSDVETRLESQAARLRPHVENALARAMAGVSHGLHGAIAYLATQVIWDRCDDEFLVRWASIFGVYRNPAVRAEGDTILITGTPGTLIPAGTRWARDDGIEFEVAAATILSQSPENISINAVEAGSAANGPVGLAASLTAPIAGIDSKGSLSVVDSGRDEETFDSLRARFLQRLRNPPAGGGPGDYIRWAKASSSPTPTRVWEGGKVPKPGWVTLWMVDDCKVAPAIGMGDIERAQVLEHIETLAPLHMHDRIVVETPTLTAFPVEVAISPFTPTMVAAVEKAVDEEVRRRAETGEGGRVFRKGWLETACGKVPGLRYHVMTVPAGDTVFAEGEIPVHVTANDLAVTQA